MLITTTGEYEGSFRSLRIFVQSRPGLTLDELYDDHVMGVTRLKEHGLNPAPVDATLRGAGGMVDEYLRRRLGPKNTA